MPVFRQLLILCVLAVAVTGVWIWYSQNDRPGVAQQQARPAAAVAVQVAPVARGLVQARIEAVGTTRAANSVNVVPTVAGRVAKIHFAAGQEVIPGDLLVSLDRDSEQAAVGEARALLDDMRRQLQRAEELVKRQTVAKAKVDELAAQYLVTQARLEAAQSRLRDREVRAPFAGVVGLRNVSVGAWVDDGTTITTLDALDTLEIEFSVPEIFFSQVLPGTPLRAFSTAYKDRDFAGTVTAIDSRIDPATRSFRARGEIGNRERALPAGMFMTVTLVLDEHDGLVVPEEAVAVEGSASYVYRVSNERAARVRVRLGTRTYGQVEILDGLQEGDLVATSGLQRLRDGIAVTLPKPPDGVPSG